MPEATITIERVFEKPGETDGRKWKRYDVKPAENPDERYSTFSDSIGGKAKEYEGGKVTVVYEETDRGNKITELRLDGPPPESRSEGGSRQAEHPATQRAIRASVALTQAVATVSHTVKLDDDTDAISAKVSPLTRRYFQLLSELTEHGQEIPF